MQVLVSSTQENNSFGDTTSNHLAKKFQKMDLI
jgi:hypothetical protein